MGKRRVELMVGKKKSAKIISLPDRKKVNGCGSFPHCQSCPMPDPQKLIMRTYDGDTCGVYSDYMDERDSFDGPFTLEELTLKCRDSFLGKYPDVQNFNETIREMLIEVDVDDLGIVVRIDDNLFRLA